MSAPRVKVAPLPAPLNAGTDVISLRPDDASFAMLRERYGEGSPVVSWGIRLLVEEAAASACTGGYGEWMPNALAYARRNPVLGARVLREVRERAARVVMRAVGEWLERVAPGLFREAAPDYIMGGYRDGDE